MSPLPTGDENLAETAAMRKTRLLIGLSAPHLTNHSPAPCLSDIHVARPERVHGASPRTPDIVECRFCTYV